MCRSILPPVLPLLPLHLYWDPHFEHAKSPRARANQRGKLLDASPLPSVSQAFNASMLCKLCHNQCRAQKEQPIAKKGQEEKKKRKKERRKSKKEKKRKKEKEKLGNTKRLTQPNKPDMLASIATRIEDDGELCIEIHMEMMICTSQNEGPQNKGLRRANMDRNPAKEHTKSVYLRNEEDKSSEVVCRVGRGRSVEYVMSKILGFYKECLELGPEYLTGMDDEGEVTFDPFTKPMGNLYAMTGRKAHLLEDKQIPSVGVFDEVFNIWKAFGGNTRDLGLFEEETEKTTNLYQHLSRISTQKLETASQIIHDAVTTHLKTASQDLQTKSDCTTQPII
ncbi:hypothetical protein Tco_1155316 [Tanacetum coccineum]